MEKSKRETGGIAKFIEEAKDCRNNPYVLNQIIEAMSEKIDDLQAKAAAYDRLMSGGKKTLKEVANFYGLPIALSSYGDWLVFHDKPWASDYDWFSDCLKFGELPRIIHNLDIDFTGSWQDSLTLPDGWEEK